ISGRVTWADGTPVDMATVWLPTDQDHPRPAGSSGFFTLGCAVSEADGSFELTGLHPGMDFDVCFQLRGDLEPGQGQGELAGVLLRGLAAGTRGLHVVF